MRKASLGGMQEEVASSHPEAGDLTQEISLSTSFMGFGVGTDSERVLPSGNGSLRV